MNSTPILTPLLALLRSRKFIVALASVLGSILVTRIPELKPWVDDIVGAIVFAASILVGSIAAEDISKRLSETRTIVERNVVTTPNDEVRETVDIIKDTLFPTPEA